MTHYGNVTKSETHALFSRKEHAYSMWHAVTHVKDVSQSERYILLTYLLVTL